MFLLPSLKSVVFTVGEIVLQGAILWV